jgi:hypothetical protein
LFGRDSYFLGAVVGSLALDLRDEGLEAWLRGDRRLRW